MNDDFVLKGDICYSVSKKEIRTIGDGFLVCIGGKSKGVFEKLPEKYEKLSVKDYSGMLILPGMIDLHIHAPQYAFRGIGMDLELLDWLKAYTFPEEAKYESIDYAAMAYSAFVNAIRKSATTRASIFATVHTEATELLMDMLEESGLETYVGKVNMDMDAPDNLREPSAGTSVYDTYGWLNNIGGKYNHTYPILTPRFLPSCSHKLLTELAKIQKAENLPIQSHLSENPGEVELVKKLYPNAAFYGDGYNKYGLFGNTSKTIMAHCIYTVPEEVDMIETNGVYVAHCPASNMNLSSGIAPIRAYLDRGIHVGIGTDVAGGESISMFRSTANAIQVSKLYWRLVDESKAPLTFDEAFYLATLGGGEFFGRVGSFEEDYEFDAIVLDDQTLHLDDDLSIHQRLERAVYQGADFEHIVDKYVSGRKIRL